MSIDISLKNTCTCALIFISVILSISIESFGQNRREMTVFDIRNTNKNGYTVVTFSHSQRLYTLPVNVKHYKRYLNLLKKSENEKIAVYVDLEKKESDIIISVQKAGKKGR